MKKETILSTPLAEGQAAIFYLGQEGFLFRFQDSTLVVDPYLTDYVDRNCCTQTVQWKRLYPSPLSPEDLDFVDYVLVTHEHFDHADPDTLSVIAKNCSHTQFVCPAPIKNTLLSYGISEERIIPAEADDSYTLSPFTITPVPAAHEELHKNTQGQYLELGYRITFGDLAVFHAGDGCIYDGLEERIMDMDILFLPINGRSVYKNREDIIGNMTEEEAIELAGATRSRMLVPMHFDLYEINGVNPAVFVDKITRTAPGLCYHIFKPGERYLVCK